MTVTKAPATRAPPFRDGPAFAAIARVTVPLPAPELDPTMETNGDCDCAVHAQLDVPCVTVIVTAIVVAAAVVETFVGDTLKAQNTAPAAI